MMALLPALALALTWLLPIAADLTTASDQPLRGRRLADNATIVGGNPQTTPISYFVRFGDFRCGATLITADIVLTAAHCVDSGFPTSVIIAPTTTSDGTTVNVDTSNSARHQLWTGNLLQGFDVAVLKLVSPVDTAAFPVIQLNTDCNKPTFCETLQLYGFGLTSDGGSLSEVLKTVNSNYQWLGSGNPYMRLLSGFGTAGACQGDSGGPAVIGNVQYGIASFVQGGCAQGNPDGYARVSTYYTWIQQQVCAKSTDTTNFSCGRQEAWGGSIRDGLSRFYYGTQGAVQGMASQIGFGTEYAGDIEAFPMGGQQ